MRTGSWVGALGIGAGVLACSPSPGAVDPCPKVVVQDSVRAFASGDSVYLQKTTDTLPKPHHTCVTIYTAAKDTLPKP